MRKQMAKMTNKEFGRMVARAAGNSPAHAYLGQKSSAHEVAGHYCPIWRKEWITRGLGLKALKGPVGKLP